MVHKIVSFSKNKFIRKVVENNLPPDSVPLLSVSEGIRNGNRKPGLLRLEIRSIAICAKVSKHAINFCISEVTGIWRFVKSVWSNLEENQMVAPFGKRTNPPIWQMLLYAHASAAHGPCHNWCGKRLFTIVVEVIHSRYIWITRKESGLSLLKVANAQPKSPFW